MQPEDQRGLFAGLIGDGRSLLCLTGTALLFSGGLGIVQSTTGHLLPHDSQAIGMDAVALAHAANSHLVHFMFHDRVAYSGTLLAIGSAYWWLAEFPLKAREAWAWWAFAISGTAGFLSFLAYLGYGYLDIWHAAATLLLLPLFVLGLVRTRANLLDTHRFRDAWSPTSNTGSFYAKAGRLCIGACGAGLTLAGLTIIGVGMTVVFVPQDLTFMGMSRAEIQAISPMLIPVIAHDRAGFDGGLLSAGLLIVLIARNAPITRSFVEVIAIMGACGFGAALGVHVAIGYLDATHLAPAVAGLLLFAVGLLLCAMALAQRTRERSTCLDQPQSAAFK